MHSSGRVIFISIDWSILMRSLALSRRFVISLVLLLGVLGLLIPIARAQTRPEGAPSDPKTALRERISAKVEQLIRQTEERIELQRLMDRANSAVGVQAAAVNGGKGLAAIAQELSSEEYQLKQIEVERDLTGEQSGMQNPRYKVLAKRAAIMKEVYDREVEAAHIKAVARLESARNEAAAIQTKLNAAANRVEATKQELLDLVMPVGATTTPNGR
jgi:hypothetical protein